MQEVSSYFRFTIPTVTFLLMKTSALHVYEPSTAVVAQPLVLVLLARPSYPNSATTWGLVIQHTPWGGVAHIENTSASLAD